MAKKKPTTKPARTFTKRHNIAAEVDPGPIVEVEETPDGLDPGPDPIDPVPDDVRKADPPPKDRVRTVPKDRSGVELKVGDPVVIQGSVVAVEYYGDEFGNDVAIRVETVSP